MPSLLKKIRLATTTSVETNPYAKRDNPHNPNYNPTSISQASDPLSSTPPQGPTASPRGSIDYLAEARQVSGRDPVTGKKATQKAPSKSKSFPNIRSRTRVGGGRGGESSRDGSSAPYNPATDPANPFADAEAFRDATSGAAASQQAQKQRQQTAGNNRDGSRYEQYIWQMKERDQARMAWQEPAGGSFYAPPQRKTVTEYYGGGRGGGGDGRQEVGTLRMFFKGGRDPRRGE